MAQARNDATHDTQDAAPTDDAAHVADCDNPECEGIDADADRQLLSFPCWNEWASYDG